MTTPVVYEKRGAVATITLNRPEARNALNPEMVCRLADAIQDYMADPNLRVAILTGAGDKAFCAGGDLGTMLPLLTGARQPEDEWDRRVLNDPLVMPTHSLRSIPLFKPIIAAINGFCLAAGTELMLGTDIRIAAAHATFGLPEVKRALIPFAGSLVRLPRQVSYCHAMEILLVGDSIGAEEGADEVLPMAREFAERIAANGPVAVQRVKETVLRTSGLPLEESYRLEDESMRAVMATEDAREGPRAFIEKRPPRYTGK